MTDTYEVAGMIPTFSGTDSLRMKIDRAGKHLQEFNSLLSAQQPYLFPFTREDDLVEQRYVLRCEFGPVTPDIVLSLADFAYSLRSGLDQLAWHLALFGNPISIRDVIFPICSNRTPRSEELFRKSVWNMPCEAIAVIKQLQPYNEGQRFRNHPLWQLSKLSKIDKYGWPAVRPLWDDFTVEPWGRIGFTLDDKLEMSWPLSAKESVTLEARVTRFAFSDPTSHSDSFALELTDFEIAEVYRYVRDEVLPRFTRFFRPATHI